MSYQLNIDQMLEALTEIRHPQANLFQRQVEGLATNMAVNLAAALGIECGEATFQGIAFAGTCVPFMPAYDGQEIPDVFVNNEFDDRAEWDDG